MKYKIEILSPVHIGSGEEISPMEYVIDEKFHRIDMEALFRDNDFNADDFIENSKFGSFYLGEFYADTGKRHILYTESISKDAKDYIINKKASIREFINTSGRVYIPGSSIKGAIRTAIMWYALKNDNELFYEMEDYLNEIINKKIKRSRKFAGKEIEKKIFGNDAKHDLMKALFISDSEIISQSYLGVEDIRILTTRMYGYGWKNFHTVLEALKPGTRLDIEIKIDEFLEKNYEKLGWNKKMTEYLRNFKQICNEYAKDLIDYELSFFKIYNNDGRLDPIIDFYNNLYNQIGDGMTLRISWGAGWHGMTVGRLIEEDVLERLRHAYRLGKRRNEPYYVKPFPKTRKIIFENGKPKYPMGWIKLEGIK